MSKYRISFDGRTYEMEVEKIDGSAVISSQPKPAPAAVPSQPAVKTASQQAGVQPSAAANAVVSPMPGTILKVHSNVGETVQKGQAILVLEAMKMENEIVAPKEGKIVALHVKQGDTVQGGAALFEIGE